MRRSRIPKMAIVPYTLPIPPNDTGMISRPTDNNTQSTNTKNSTHVYVCMYIIYIYIHVYTYIYIYSLHVYMSACIDA